GPARAHGARADRAAPVPGLGCWSRRPPGPRHSGDGMTTARSRFIAAAFDHGQVPTIACFNKASTALGVDFDRLIAALQKLVDQAINLAAAGAGNVFYAYETADAVEEVEFAIDGIAMSDFVYPAWFEAFRKPGSAQFDYAKKVRRPFQILAGGYMSVFKNGKWTQLFGSRAKARRFRQEDRRGHRSTYRGRTHRMRRSRRPAR